MPKHRQRGVEIMVETRSSQRTSLSDKRLGGTFANLTVANQCGKKVADTSKATGAGLVRFSYAGRIEGEKNPPEPRKSGLTPHQRFGLTIVRFVPEAPAISAFACSCLHPCDKCSLVETWRMVLA
jgi:hypothetical protein